MRITLLILLVALAGLGFPLSGFFLPQALAAPASQPVTRIGQIENPRITESSGLVASRRHDDVFWTHNDSGAASVLYAISRQGKPLGTFPVNVRLSDWEDIALDEQNQIYIADVGNNGRRRNRIAVHRVDEPDPRQAADNPPVLRPNATWHLRYPNQPFDCEALFVWKGFGYLISKEFTGMRASLYRFPLKAAPGPVVLEYVGALPIRSPVTAADITPDGSRLAVLSVLGPNVFVIDGDVRKALNASPAYVRLIEPQIEACAFTLDGVLITNEQRDIYFIANDALPARDGEP